MKPRSHFQLGGILTVILFLRQRSEEFAAVRGCCGQLDGKRISPPAFSKTNILYGPQVNIEKESC